MTIYEVVRGIIEERGMDLAEVASIKGPAQADEFYVLVQDMFQGVVRTVGGCPMYYDGRVFVPCSGGDFQSAIRKCCVEAGVKAAALRALGGWLSDAFRSDPVEPDRRWVAFEDCLVNLDSFTSRDFTPSIVTDIALPYVWDRKARCPQWEAFLQEVLPSAGARAALQEFFGCVFLDRKRMSIEKMAFLIGAGANGKSVCLNVIGEVLGERYVSHLSPRGLSDERQIVSLRGRLLNISPDVRSGAELDSSLKALASGQEVDGYRLYKGAEQVTAPPLVFAMNGYPRVTDESQGMARRLLVFPFSVSIPEERQDRELAWRIAREEAVGVIAWMFEGARRLLRTGGVFTYDPTMEEAREKFLRWGHAGGATVSIAQTDALDTWAQTHGWTFAPTSHDPKGTRVPFRAICAETGIDKRLLPSMLARHGATKGRGKETYYILYKI